MRHHTAIFRSIRRVCSVGALALALAFVFAATPASGQVRDVEPYHVVVTGDHVYLRCGAGGVWYAIGYANAGDLLRVNAEGYKWIRVAYPTGLPALVSADDANYNADQGVVVIQRPARLKANNIHGKRLGDSWKNLLSTALNPGATLKYIDTLRDDAGKTEGYIVEAPLGAQAFISEQFTRRATPTEVTAHLAREQKERELALKNKQNPGATAAATPGPTSTPALSTPADATTASTTDSKASAPTTAAPINTVAATPGVPTHPAPAQTNPALLTNSTNAAPTTAITPTPSDQQRGATPKLTTPTTPADATQLTDSASQSPPAPLDEVETTPTFTTPSTSASSSTEPSIGASSRPADSPSPTAGKTNAAPAATSPTPASGNESAASTPPPTFESLESAFVALSKEPIEDAEISPLIAEYGRLLRSLADTEADKDQRFRIGQRLELLDVRLALQENMRTLNAVSAKASADAEAMRLRLAKLDQSRPYTLVGRLSASALYDGVRLPFMYRLQSVEGGSGRTIAYIMPSTGLDLNGKLGSIVGVEGDSKIDPALQLRIVTPSRVDLLTPALSSATTPPDQP